MSLFAGCGQAQALDGREAGLEAAREALSFLGRAHPSLGFVFASHDYAIQQVMNGVVAQVGDTPLLGFKTPAEITSTGVSRRTVVVALLSGTELQARAEWWPGFADGGAVTGPRQTAEKLLAAFQTDLPAKALLFVADGLGADASPFIDQMNAYLHSLPPHINRPSIAGCLSGSDIRHGRAFQVGGQRAGSGGLAAAVISGKVNVSVGSAHGWAPVGTYFRVTKSRGLWIRALDDQLPGDQYAQAFGVSKRDWTFPPLNELVRLYPLGLEKESAADLQSGDYLIRSPVRMESDGCLRMNASIPEGAIVHLLTGSADRCMEAARTAAQKALDAYLSDPRRMKPVLALLLVDAAWNPLLQARPGEEVLAVQSVLGADIPIAGAYTFGQISASGNGGELEMQNQHIQVILFGEEY